MEREGFLVKQGEWLIPATDDDRNEILSLKDGDIVPYKLNDARRLWRNKKYWLLLKKVQEHLSEKMAKKFPTPEKIHTEIKLQNGHFDVHVTLGGKEIYVVSSKVGSTAFKNMGEKRFKEFVKNEAKPTILKYFLKDVDEETFDNEFLNLIFDD
jgi:hypothetical protein